VSKTERFLLEAHKSAVVRLADICDGMLGFKYQEARKQAALNTLPFPVFKVRDSVQSPYLVRVDQLAAWLDARAEEAAQDWKRSQV
jgi:hypothetical protein